MKGLQITPGKNKIKTAQMRLFIVVLYKMVID